MPLGFGDMAGFVKVFAVAAAVLAGELLCPSYQAAADPSNEYYHASIVQDNWAGDPDTNAIHQHEEQLKAAASASGSYTFHHYSGTGKAIWCSGSSYFYAADGGSYYYLDPHGDDDYYKGTLLPGSDYVIASGVPYVEMAVCKISFPPPSEPQGPTSPEPINLVRGAMMHEETDVFIPCPGVDLEFRRFYDSQLSGGKTPLGPRWTHTYNWNLAHTNTVWDGKTNDTLAITQGRALTRLLTTATNGLPDCPASCQWVAFQDVDWGVGTNDNGYLLYADPEPMRYLFDSNGILTKISDAWSNSVTLSYTNSYPSNLLIKAQHSNGQSLDFTYQTNLLIKVQSPSTNFYVTFAYNAAGELTNATRTTSSGSASKGYAYDAYTNHNMTGITNANGDGIVYLYATNELGQTSSTCTNMALNGTYYRHTVKYSAASNSSEMTLFRGETNQVYTYVHDPTNYKVTAVYGPGSTNLVQLSYYDNAFFNLTNETTRDNDLAPNESVIVRRQFGAGHTLTQEGVGYCAEPSNMWNYSWDPPFYWNLKSATDPEGHKTEFIDGKTNGLPSQMRLYWDSNSFYSAYFAYTTNGMLSCVTNANGHWTKFYRDGYGRVNKVEPQLGPASEYSNNVLGLVEKITLPGDSGNRVTTFGANELGWVTNILYPNNLSETFAFDSLGNMTNRVDTAGRTTRYTYLPTRKLSSVIRVLSASSAVTNSVTYDNQFNTISLKDAKARPVETYVLDIQDRPVTITNLEGQTMSVTYGLGDFVKSITRFDGTVISNSYNSDGLLSAMSYPDSTNTFAYLKNGLLSTAANETCTVSNSWSFANRLTDATVSGLTASPLALSYSYHPAGQVSNVVSIAGTNVYALDAADRVSTLTAYPSALGQQTFNLAYNTNNGLVSQVTQTNSGITATYGYGVMDQVTNITWRDASSNILRAFALSYNDAMMITQKIATANGQTTVDAYELDNLDRLVREKRTEGTNTVFDIRYAYDEVGNRTAKTNGSTVVTYSLPGGTNGNRLAGWTATSTNDFAEIRRLDVSGFSTETIGTNQNLGRLYVSNSVATDVPSVEGSNFTADAFLLASGTNQLIAAIGDAAGNVGYDTNTVVIRVVTNASYLHNAAGCVTNITYGGSNFADNIGLTWDSQYQLTSAYTNGALAEAYTYDAFGRRVSISDGTTTNYMVYDGLHAIAEVDSTGGLRRAYVFGPGIDNWLAMTVYTGVTAKTYFYLTDYQGTVHAVADETGTIVESYRYDAWGRVLGVYDGSGTPLTESAIGNKILWQGREYSWKTGLYYFRYRWYDPITGRWLSNDPIGISGGLNQYEAFSSNPVNSLDPLGFQKQQDAKDLQLSGKMLDKMAEMETFVDHIYPDQGDNSTIGYGHKLKKGEAEKYAKGITKAQALELLRNDAYEAECAVRRNVKVKLYQWEYDALVSFTFNVGQGNLAGSTLLRKLNAGDYDAAAEEFSKWNKVGKDVSKGLTKRREIEKEWFMGWND